MPLYEFAAPDGTTISVLMDTKQPAIAYRQQVVKGVTYKRVYEVPHMAVDSRGGTTEKDFIRKTTGKNLRVGEMQAMSAEMQEKRTEKEGKDPVKETFYAGYEKTMKMKHKDVVKREKDEARKTRLIKAKKSLAHFGVSVTL